MNHLMVALRWGTPDALGPWLGRVMITKTPPQSPLMTRHRERSHGEGDGMTDTDPARKSHRKGNMEVDESIHDFQ